ncbi:glycerol-3-phosphate acyltransferase [Oceanithermus sp.]
MNWTVVPLAVIAYFIGAAPLGYWLVRRLSGKSPRLASVYNLGLESAARLLGLGPLLAAFVADVFKGYLAVYLARGQGLEAALLLAVAAYLGHINPPSFLIPERPFRPRGGGLLIGILAALSVSGYPYLQAFLPLVFALIVWALTGYLSLAAVTVAFTMALVLMFLPVSTLAQVLAWVLAALVIWRYKENLGRILEGTEPKLGEPAPLPGRDQVVCAFMIHPLTLDDFWQSPRFAWMKPLVRAGLVRQSWIERLAEFFRPMKVGEIRGVRTKDGREIRCYLISAPLLPHQITGKPELATRRATQGARLAAELGASVFGLGAFWSVVGEKGLKVQEAVPEIQVTNGGAYTAGTVKAAIPQILERFEKEGKKLSEVTAAVVGANGVVAFGIARQIAPLVGRLILIGRNAERLERSAASLRKMVARKGAKTEIVTSTDIPAIREAELVFTATSDPGAVIFPDFVKPGAWIYDEGVPPDVDPAVKKVPGVRVIPGGVVRLPGEAMVNLDLRFGGPDLVPACLAETMILAAEEAWERKSLGGQTASENIQFFVEKAAELGFEVVD